MNIAIHPESPSPALTEALRAAGGALVSVPDAAAVADLEPEEGWGLVVVELGEDPTAGLTLARRVRDGSSVPVLVVAARRHLPALAAGDFDDFVLAPLDPDEVAVRVARIAVGAGGTASADEMVTFKDLTLNLATYQATVGITPIDLTFMEYELLRFFATNAGRVWSREQLLNRVWGYDYFGGARTVDVHVRRLRSKLGEERASWIATVRSVGYRFG
ncbi:MAG: response regulator transcription factor [Acidimicrobiia bacterium]|nr:response regulator transcription factor [Acidimicrobiia bacterium]